MSEPPDPDADDPRDESGRSATTSIEKVCAVLRALAGSVTPLRLVDIAAMADLHQATTSRILESLAENGLVRRHARRRLYGLSPAAGALGRVSGAGRLREAALASMLRLSVLSDDAVMLSVRCGDHALYVAHEFGRHPIRVRTLDIGHRRPLGVGVGGLAMLAELPPEEASGVLDRVTPALARFPDLDRARVEEAARRARARGYAQVVDAIVAGGGGVAVTVNAPEIGLTGALSIVGPTARILAREDMLADLLRDERERIRTRLFAEG